MDQQLCAVRTCRAVTDNNWFAYNHIGIQYDQDGMELVRADPSAGTRLQDTIEFALKKWGLEETGPQTPQILLDHSAENFKNSIDIKPDYDFGNNNLGVYYRPQAQTGRPRTGGEVLPRLRCNPTSDMPTPTTISPSS